MEKNRMPTPRRFRPIQGLVVALVLVPAWKLAEPLLRSSPKLASGRAIKAGRELFVHEWRVDDSLANGDGLGPVFNATSCVGCHQQGGPGGAGPLTRNVTVYGLTEPHPRGFPQSGVVHQKAVASEFQETLSLVHPSLPSTPSIALERLIGNARINSDKVSVTQRNTPALFGAGLIDSIPEAAIIAHRRERSTPARLIGFAAGGDPRVRGKVARLADGSAGRFGWKAEFATLNDFVKAACAGELGLSNPGRPQPIPLRRASYSGKGMDLTEEQCTLLTEFVRSLPAPISIVPDDRTLATEVTVGKELFRTIGCAECHLESLDRIHGLYSDLLLHDMGSDLESSTGSYGTIVPKPATSEGRFEASDQPAPGEWRTAPLWGVADSAPYLHDGRAESLEEAILAHAGEAVDVTARFKDLNPGQQQSIVSFLKTLRAPLAEPVAYSVPLTAR
jgi:CxxC motif-containing protein (DUF1111 family)